MVNNSKTTMANDTPGVDFIPVIVGIGPDQHTFLVRKDLLTTSSSFFRSCLTSAHFPEGRENLVRLPEDNAKAFAIIYTLLIESENLEDYTWPYYLPQEQLHDPVIIPAYLLAEKLCIEDVCNQLMENIIEAFDYYYDYCTEKHDIKHSLSGYLAGLNTYHLPDLKLRDWTIHQIVDSAVYSGIWLFCDCEPDCECFYRCICKAKCTCGLQKRKRDQCDVCRSKARWQCTCQLERIVKEGCCSWCQFVESDEEHAVLLREAIEQEKQRLEMPKWQRPERDDCEFHVHVDTEKCYDHHRPAHLVGVSRSGGEEAEQEEHEDVGDGGASLNRWE